MSLNKPGGSSIVETKVVAKVSDLPSPLAMQGDERFIVKEDDGVYAINRKTNTWECIGSIKKVGGRRPEDLAAHIDSKTNPHGTNLQQVYETDPHLAVTEKTGEVILESASPAVKALLRLLAKGGALKIGADAGKLVAPIWVNAGKRGQALPQLAIVDDVGNPVAVIDSDGNIELAGAATVRGGFKGPAVFEDEITAAEGLFGSANPEGDGFALELGTGKSKGKVGPVVISPGRSQKVIVTDVGVGVGTEPKAPLDVVGNVKFSGYVQAELTPDEDKKYVVGAAKRRWKAMFAGMLDLDAGADATAVSVKIDKAQTKNVLQVTKQDDGDVLVLDGDGDLGLGTSKPTHRLDVRGSGIAIGAPVGKARATLADNGDGTVVLGFNRNPDDSPEDKDQHSWAVTPGGKDDAFTVRRRGKGGEWQTLLAVTPAGSSIAGAVRVQSLDTRSLNTERLTSSKAAITLGEVVSYEGASHVFKGKHVGFELVEDDAAFEVSIGPRLLLGVHKDAVIGSGSLGTAENPWSAAYVQNELNVAGTKVSQGLIESESLELATKNPVGIRKGIELLDTKFNVINAKSGRLSLVGEIPERSVFIDMSKDAYGIRFTGKGASIRGVHDMEIGGLGVGVLSVEGAAKFGEVAAITDKGLALNAPLAVNGLRFQKLEEELVLDGQRAETKLKIPAGVRVEAVMVTVLDDVRGARIWQVGDAGTADRFVSPTTKFQAGSVVPGLNHCDRGQSVQVAEGAVVVTADAHATGKFLISVHYVQAR